MARPKQYIREVYGLQQNPFPPTAVVQWGSSDERENGALFNVDVCPQEYEEASTKFVVSPVDSGSKFHSLWSLGEGDEAKGYGKTVLLHYLARQINADFGKRMLMDHDFDEKEASETPILAAMGTFNMTDVTTLSAVSLEQVRYLVQMSPQYGKSPIHALRERILKDLDSKGEMPEGVDSSEAEADAIRKTVREAALALRGKTLSSPDQKFMNYFANGDWQNLVEYLRNVDAKKGFEVLSTCLIIARAAGVKRVFLIIDQVEDFANADTPKKRRHMEVERFRDIAIETQPFGEMTSYILTMHPAAARMIDEYWSLARLPKIDRLMKQNQRITVTLRPVKSPEEVEKLFTSYMGKFRLKEVSVAPIHPFDRAALAVILENSEGRPGRMLELAHNLIEEGASGKWAFIGEKEVRELVEESVLPGAEEKPARRRRGIGLSE